MKTCLMLKDEPVLEVDNYNCRILDYDRLPVSLRYHDVNYDDAMHYWTRSRCISMSRTYAKNLAALYHGIRHDSYSMAKLYHFATLTDSYWMKDEVENLKWKDVSLFDNPFDKQISRTALTGEYTDISLPYGRLHTPETTTQGMSAKCWVKENSGIYLYKIGRKEIAASEILTQLNIPHVDYTEADPNVLAEIARDKKIREIETAGEIVARCPLITSEDISIVTWEDLQVGCDRNDITPIKYIENEPAYKQMQIADYILGNSDRHEQNWGFFMDNNTGRITGFCPLMDHDHAFDNTENIPSQTSEKKETLKEAAFRSIQSSNLNIQIKRPHYLTDSEWFGVQARTSLLRDFQLYKSQNVEGNDCRNKQ
ncbi:MAG: hypothetical protein LUG61_01700 [Lachnospiraceae bacterium]|nr:hypothetical protein [Lachnospiraceae bacterium]